MLDLNRACFKTYQKNGLIHPYSSLAQSLITRNISALFFRNSIIFIRDAGTSSCVDCRAFMNLSYISIIMEI